MKNLIDIIQEKLILSKTKKISDKSNSFEDLFYDHLHILFKEPIVDDDMIEQVSKVNKLSNIIVWNPKRTHKLTTNKEALPILKTIQCTYPLKINSLYGDTIPGGRFEFIDETTNEYINVIITRNESMPISIHMSKGVKKIILDIFKK